jgi:hypothetical protein
VVSVSDSVAVSVSVSVAVSVSVVVVSVVSVVSAVSVVDAWLVVAVEDGPLVSVPVLFSPGPFPFWSSPPPEQPARIPAVAVPTSIVNRRRSIIR